MDPPKRPPLGASDVAWAATAMPQNAFGSVVLSFLNMNAQAVNPAMTANAAKPIH